MLSPVKFWVSKTLPLSILLAFVVFNHVATEPTPYAHKYDVFPLE
jgi:hypothetical protein